MIRIVDALNRPKRLKGIKDFSAGEGIIELWEDPSLEVMVPTEVIPGYDLYSWISKMVPAEQIQKY